MMRELKLVMMAGFKPVLRFAALTNALHRKSQRGRLAIERRDQLLYFP